MLEGQEDMNLRRDFGGDLHRLSHIAVRTVTIASGRYQDKLT